LVSLPIISGLTTYIQQILSSISVSEAIPTINLPIVNIKAANQTQIGSAFNYQSLLVLGSLLFISFTFYKITKVLVQFKMAKYDSTHTYKLLISDQKDSFSFFNLIHLSAHLDQEEKSIVLEHELIHYEKKHSFDIILMEVYHSFFWYNPLLFLLKKELIHVHEFEVDEQMYGKYENDYIKYLLAYALGTNSSQLLLTSQFYNKLTLTKRTTIMKNSIKKQKLLILALPVAALAFSLTSWTDIEAEQQDNIPKSELNYEQDKEKIDVLPEFPGGQEAFNKFLIDNIKYPKQAKKDNIEGTVMSEFIISKDGSIKDLSIKKSVRTDIDNEAIRVIESMPNWIAGEKDGQKVDVQFFLPITFKLTD
jgi:TonB family protein